MAPETVSRQSIATERPDFVFIGNSMLETRIDLERFEQLNNNQNALALIDPGVSSAGWFLRLKNHVIAADNHPATVFIFFRSDELTNPKKHTTGRAESALKELKSDREQTFDSIVAHDRTLNQVISTEMRVIYSIQERRPSALAALERTAASVVHPNVIVSTARRALSIVGIGQFDRTQYRATLDNFNTLKQKTNAVFSRENYRSTDHQDAETTSVGEFSKLVDNSFLPAMLDLVATTDIQLVFVKVQNRPNRDGTLRFRPGIAEYDRDLRSYLDSRGFDYMDMTGTPEITLDKYLDGDHIVPSFMEEYTELFTEKLNVLDQR